jgi:hypothetical protein
MRSVLRRRERALVLKQAVGEAANAVLGSSPPSFRALGLNVFTTCQQSIRSDASGYLEEVADIARWSDEAGCEGMLIYTDNGLVDPWLVAQLCRSRS